MTDHDKKSDIKEDSKDTLTHKDKTKIISEIIKGLPVIIAAIIGGAAIGYALFSNNNNNNNNNENHSDPIIVNNNNNNIYLPSETEHKDETSESTTTTYSDTVLYEETSAFSTVPSYTQPPSTSIAYTEPSYNTETSASYDTEPSYNYNNTSSKSTTATTVDIWEILLNDTSTQKDSTTQKTSVNETTVSEDIWSGYVYQVALEKQKPNLLRFTVQGNLDIFSLQGEQKWETSIKSNGLFYAARLNTIGKEILSNKVYSFEYKNGGIYYYDTDIPISSYYDSTRDVFIIEVTINDQDTFESSSLETNTIAIIHDFY